MVTSRRFSCILFSLFYFPLQSYYAAGENSNYYTCFDDASWAIMTPNLSSELGNKQAVYDEFLSSCRLNDANNDAFDRCYQDELFRMEMNQYQPQSVYNYTKTGFKKMKAPKELYDLVYNFWSMNRQKHRMEWYEINTYHNMWVSPPTIVHIADPTFQGGGTALQAKIWDSVRDVLEEWTGQMLAPVSLYGIRLYHNNSILAPHVDRMPLIVSAILNVDQDVDEPWPLEVYDHHGVAHNVTMEPGDMVLYESHSTIHGRPFPLRGNFFANLFLHFEPIGSSEYIEQSRPGDTEDIPPYLVPGSKWVPQWKESNPFGWSSKYSDPVTAAQTGNERVLKRLGKIDPSLLDTTDPNGWKPIHEAVRSGHLEALKVLVEFGSDINAETRGQESPLRIARVFLGEDHEVTEYLKELGAQDGWEYEDL